MTTDSDSEIAELMKKIEDADVKVGQVEAALDGHAAEPGEEARAKAFQRAGRYANSKLWPAAKLPDELASLRDNLTADKNLLLVELRKQGAHSTAPRHALVFQVLCRRKSRC